jgi:hypothetical protein
MKNYLVISAMAVCMSTTGAFAQNALNSASEAVANSQSISKATARGGDIYISEPASRTIRNTGTTTLRSAPQVVAPSMSSGHPCAYAPVSVGVSVVGFGGAFGGQRIDDACLLAQMGYRAPSVSMIAARNPQACRALEATGHIPAGYCGGGRHYAQPVYKTGAVRVGKGKGKVAKTYALQNGGSNCRMVFATANTTKKVCS